MNLLEHAHRCAYQSGDIPTRRAHTVHQLATLLTRRLPVTLEALRLEHAELDGYASTASGADRGGSSSKGSVSRPVEACVLARDRDGHGITPDHNDLSEHVLTASDTTNRAWGVWRELFFRHNIYDVDDWLNVATIALRQAHRICDRYGPPNDPNALTAMRCVGTGDADGATCEQLSDYRVGDGGYLIRAGDGRCIDCRTIIERRADETKAERIERERRTEAERKRKQQRAARSLAPIRSAEPPKAS